MDMNMLAQDVETALGKLPPRLVVNMLNLIMQYAPDLMREMPEIIKLLAPHFNAGVLEKTAGLLTVEEIAQTLLPIIQRYVMTNASAG